MRDLLKTQMNFFQFPDSKVDFVVTTLTGNVKLHYTSELDWSMYWIEMRNEPRYYGWPWYRSHWKAERYAMNNTWSHFDRRTYTKFKQLILREYTYMSANQIWRLYFENRIKVSWTTFGPSIGKNFHTRLQPIPEKIETNKKQKTRDNKQRTKAKSGHTAN